MRVPDDLDLQDANEMFADEHATPLELDEFQSEYRRQDEEWGTME